MFAAIGYTDEQFFNLQTDVIASVLKNHQNVLLDFVLKLGMRKTVTHTLLDDSTNVLIEEMDVEFASASDQVTTSLRQTNQTLQVNGNHL